MALKSSNFYKFIFDGGQEYTVTHESEEIKSVISAVSDGLLNLDYIKLQYQESEPLYVKKNRLFSIQKLSPKTIGTQTRVWRLT
jgi:hypothetical protein